MMKLGFFVLLALVVAANAAGDLDGYKKPHRFGDCVGHDVKHIKNTNLPVCTKECNTRANCKTFLFVESGANSYCWLKNYECPKLTATTNKEYHFYNKCSKPLCIGTKQLCPGGRENVYSLNKDGCKTCRSVCKPVTTPAPAPTPAPKPTVVYVREGRYTIPNPAAAAKKCKSMGMALATRQQLDAAFKAGMDQCNCGWLTDGTAAYPIHKPRNGCGSAPAGIRECGRKPWRGLKGFDAYCFGVKKN